MKRTMPIAAVAMSLIACLYQPAMASKSLSLDEAIRLALKKNPELTTVRLQIAASLAEKGIVSRLPNPTVQMEAEEWGGQNDSKAALWLTQPLLLNGERANGMRAAELKVQIAELEAASKAQEVILRIKSLFSEAQVARQQSELDHQSQALAKEVHRAAQARFQAQSVPVTDVLRAEAELESSGIRVAQSQRRIELLQLELATAVGDESVASFGMLPVEASALPSLDSLMKRLEMENPTISQAKLGRLVAEAEKSQAVAGQLANPELGIGVVRKVDQGENLISLSMGWPLPLFGRNGEEIERGKALLEKAKSEEATQQSAVALQLRQWHSDYLSQAKMMALYKEKLIPTAEEIYRQAALSYRYGRSSHLDLLDAKRRLIEAREGLIECKGRAELAVFRIESLFAHQEIKQ